MIRKLSELKKGEQGIFLRCEDTSIQTELMSYGFLGGVGVSVFNKNKNVVVVEILDTLYSINHRLATQIVVKVVNVK